MRALGLDLSHWDWSFDPAVSMKTIDFAIQKVSEGSCQDSRLEIIWSGVKKVPIRGAYHYLRSATPWQSQADFFLKIVKKKDYHIYALDYEDTGNILDASFADMAHQWMDYVKSKTTKTVILYTCPAIYDDRLYRYGNWMIDYPLWIAQYWKNPTPNKNPGMPRNRNDWVIYQWACEQNYVGHGHEYGCGLDLNKPTSVDLDVFNGTTIEMQNWINTGNVPPPLPTPTIKTGYVNCTIGLNVRDKPSVSGKKLYAIPYKTNVVIYAEKDGWYKISQSEEWVFGAYITLK